MIVIVLFQILRRLCQRIQIWSSSSRATCRRKGIPFIHIPQYLYEYSLIQSIIRSQLLLDSP